MQLVLCTEYRAPNFIVVVSVSPTGAEHDASDRMLEAVKCTKVMEQEQHGLYPQSHLQLLYSLFHGAARPPSACMWFVRRTRHRRLACNAIRVPSTAQRNGAMKLHVYPYPASVVTDLEGHLC